MGTNFLWSESFRVEILKPFKLFAIKASVRLSCQITTGTNFSKALDRVICKKCFTCTIEIIVDQKTRWSNSSS